MPGLPPLVRVTAPAVCSSVRASRAAAGLVPAAVAMTAVVAPGLAVSAAWTAAAGSPGAGRAPGAWPGSGAACAALRAAGRRARAVFFVRGISVTPFVSGGISNACLPVFSGRQSLCARGEVKRLAEKFPAPGNLRDTGSAEREFRALRILATEPGAPSQLAGRAIAAWCSLLSPDGIPA